MLKPNLPYFNKLQPLINDSANENLQISHKTVESRLSFANMHICLLNQVYDWKNSFERNFVKRALLDNIVLNLVGSLEACSHVLNEIYSFNIPFRDVIIDHRYPKNKEKHKKVSNSCVRCRLNKDNLPLAEFLDRELRIDSSTKIGMLPQENIATKLFIDLTILLIKLEVWMGILFQIIRTSENPKEN